MRNKIVNLLVIGGLVSVLFTGCQQAAKNFGGTVTIRLEPNEKLEEITWKETDLWYLTRPMTEDDVAETHTFRQSTEFGVFEGKVIIIETKK